MRQVTRQIAGSALQFLGLMLLALAGSVMLMVWVMK